MSSLHTCLLFFTVSGGGKEETGREVERSIFFFTRFPGGKRKFEQRINGFKSGGSSRSLGDTSWGYRTPEVRAKSDLNYVPVTYKSV